MYQLILCIHYQHRLQTDHGVNAVAQDVELVDGGEFFVEAREHVRDACQSHNLVA